MTKNEEELIDILGQICDEVPSSVEYSDWPELQDLVEEARRIIERIETD